MLLRAFLRAVAEAPRAVILGCLPVGQPGGRSFSLESLRCRVRQDYCCLGEYNRLLALGGTLASDPDHLCRLVRRSTATAQKMSLKRAYVPTPGTVEEQEPIDLPPGHGVAR